MEAAQEEVYDAHMPNIKIGNADKPALIVFSAIPGSGKSELTKRLIKNYGISSIANKDIRRSLEQTGHTEDVAIGDYTLWLLDRLVKQGVKTIVFDRNIDQWYEAAKNWATKNSYQFLVVRIDVSRNVLEKRLHNREGSKVSKVLEVLDFYSNEHERMTQNIQANIVLKEDYDLDAAARSISESVIG
jgi:predicted kinase